MKYVLAVVVAVYVALSVGHWYPVVEQIFRNIRGV